MADGGIQSVQRSFAVLEALAGHPEGMALAELAATLSLAKSTAHRLLQNLVGLGYVNQSAATGHYRATLRMFQVGSEVAAGFDVVARARGHLEALSAETGEAVHLVVPDGADIVYVYKADAASMRMASRVGLRRPMYCTGVGKAVLATYPWAEVKRIWQGSRIEALTPRTITGFDALEKQLADVRRTGWAVDDEENELGIRCVATALPGPDGAAQAAFSITGLAAQMDAARLQSLGARCLAVRKAILKDMGIVDKARTEW